MDDYKEDDLAFFHKMKAEKDEEWKEMLIRLEKRGASIVNLYEDGEIPNLKEECANEIPRLAVYPVRKGKRGCIIICAGGAFIFKSFNEAEPVADYFYEKGFQTAILDYRLQPYTVHDSAEDGHRAIAYLREHAGEYGIDPFHIAIGGFSAGGMLSNLAAVTYQNAEERPDAVFLGYGAFSEILNVGRLGFDFEKQRELARNSADVLLHPDCPPYFMFQTTFDDPRNIANMQIRLTEMGIPFEAHTFSGGFHGNGLYDGKNRVENQPHTAHWAELFAEWLEQNGFVKE